MRHGILSAQNVCGKHKEVYGTATFGPLRDTPLLGPRCAVLTGFFVVRVCVFNSFCVCCVKRYIGATSGPLRDPPWGAHSMRAVYTLFTLSSFRKKFII